jgi:hypothetical protein
MANAPPTENAMLAPLDANGVMRRAEFTFATSSLKRRSMWVSMEWRRRQQQGVLFPRQSPPIGMAIVHPRPSQPAKQTRRTRFSANKLCAKLDWAARLDKLCKTRSACHFPIIAVAQSFLPAEEECRQSISSLTLVAHIWK